MAYVDDVLQEFNGQLSVNDIYHMTYKEIGYMRKHRRESLKRKQEAREAMEHMMQQK